MLTAYITRASRFATTGPNPSEHEHSFARKKAREHHLSVVASSSESRDQEKQEKKHAVGRRKGADVGGRYGSGSRPASYQPSTTLHMAMPLIGREDSIILPYRSLLSDRQFGNEGAGPEHEH